MTSRIMLAGLIAFMLPSDLQASSPSEKEPWHDRRIPSPFACNENERAELAFSFEEDTNIIKLPKFADPEDHDEIVKQKDIDKKKAASRLKQSFQRKTT